MRSDDDLCSLRVLNALASREIRKCPPGGGFRPPPTIYAAESWKYDTSASGVKLPAGKVSKGFVTAHIVSRRDEFGSPILDAKGASDIRLLDATFHSSGNLVSITKTRDDGRVRNHL